MSINQASLVILATLSLCFTCIVSDQVDLIPTVCSNATDTVFCNQTLSTNCSTSRYDQQLMGGCITSLAMNATTNAKHVSNSTTLKNSTEAKHCHVLLEHALHNLKGCANDIKQKKAKDLGSKIDGIMTNLTTCRDELNGKGPEPEKQKGGAEKKQNAIEKLKNEVEYAIKFIDVLRAIANTMKP